MRVFEAACAVLAEVSGRTPPVGARPPENAHVYAQAEQLLRSLGYPDQDGEDRTDNHLALLALAGRVDELFRLVPADAPGLVLIGACFRPSRFGLPEPDGAPMSASGRGAGFRQAFESCMGEVAEYLSFLPWPGEMDGAGRLFAARDLATGKSIAITAQSCLRHRPGEATGTGCAAGIDSVEATCTGLLECIERAAAAQWWYGGNDAARFEPDGEIGRLLDDLRLRLRRTPARPYWLLDIRTTLPVPVIAAVSVDKDGRQPCFGFAAATDIGHAAAAAITEMCQMEASRDLLLSKLARVGESALTPIEHTHLARLRLDTRVHPWLRPPPLPRPALPGPPSPTGADGRLAWLTETLAAAGLSAWVVNLTRDAPGVAVRRVSIPGLQSAEPAGTAPWQRHSERPPDLPPFV